MVLILLSSVWLVGVYLGTLLKLPLLFILVGLAPLLCLFFMRRYWKAIVLASISLFLLIGAAVYAYGSLYSVDEDNIRFYNDTGMVEIKAVISQSPEVRDRSTRLTLSAEEILLENEWQDVAGKILVTVPLYPAYEYGDLLYITGELQTPISFSDFDYKGYLAHQGLYTTMYYPSVEFIEDGQGFVPLAWIYDLRTNLSQTLAEVLPEPQASLAQGILLGMRGNIPDDLNTNFTRSGTTHLLAISGQNIGIMVGILLAVGLWLFGRRHYLYVWLALVVIWFYAVITGMNPPVVRGAIMASMVLFAEFLGRQRSGMVGLMFAAAVMVGVNPYILGDASFQLSFLAMAGLVFIYPILRDFGRRVITFRWGDEGFLVSTANLVIDSFSATLASIIVVWPLIAYYFGIFSLAGPVATFLLTLVLPVIIILGTLTALLGLASPAVAQVFGWLVWLFLSYMILVVNGLGSPAISAIKIESLSPVFLIVYYVVLACLIWLHSRWNRVRSLVAGVSGATKAGINISSGFLPKLKWVIVPLLVIAILISYTAATLPPDDLRISFLDVGQGDAILIQKGSRQILIDGGPSPQSVMLELSECMPFWDRNIDLAVLTHPHQDHLAGLLEVLRRYDIEQVLYPPSESESQLFREWERFIEEAGIKSTIAVTGQRIDLGDGITIEVLWPSANPLKDTESDIDNNGVILLLKMGDVSFLFTGDAMSEAEWELIRMRADVKATVIKVAHHGSASSTTVAFLAVVSPLTAVISVGADNTFSLPNSVVVARLKVLVGESNLYRTDIDGTVTFITDGVKLWVQTN